MKIQLGTENMKQKHSMPCYLSNNSNMASSRYKPNQKYLKIMKSVFEISQSDEKTKTETTQTYGTRERD